MKSILFLILLLISTGFANAQILPADRRIDWNPGIPGGIPKITGPVKNIMDYGADPKGVNDSHDAIVAAMNALPQSGGVVFIPEGTYKVNEVIRITRNNIVFRGTGVQSRLLMGNRGSSVSVEKRSNGEWQKITGGFEKGSKTLTVEDGSKFKSGLFAEIEQDNDPEVMYTKPEWNQSWSKSAVGQIFAVDRVNKNTITLKTPLHLTFSPTLNVKVRPMDMVTHVGFENLYIEKTVASGATLEFNNAAYCWITGVESYHTRTSHVNLARCLDNTITMNFFHRSYSYGGGGSGYGISCDQHTTDILVENNVFDSLRHAMLVQVGSNGNVFAYNYSTHAIQGDGETNLNVGWDPPDISIHGHQAFMNLYESNELDEIGISDYWGPAGPGNTFLRNKVTKEGIFFYDKTQKQNLIGNVTPLIKDEDHKSSDNLLQGNVVNGTVNWQPGMPRDLPKSFYLHAAPAFFHGATWPVFGPDVSQNLKLPAQIRFESGHPTVPMVTSPRN